MCVCAGNRRTAIAMATSAIVDSDEEVSHEEVEVTDESGSDNGGDEPDSEEGWFVRAAETNGAVKREDLCYPTLVQILSDDEMKGGESEFSTR
jgi:hypothetical protein